ncbi:M28 family metallopeptidase [Acidobacteriia bacterium AH_259_A11_L15]|nr:M28 family metallopeptidase [Acidobacteriia bacterium AH_259_A11_L15]
MKLKAALAGALIVVLVIAVAWAQSVPPPTKAMQRAQAVINARLLRGHTEFLAHDLLEGRAPGTRGGDLAAHYIAAQFARMGLRPAGENGTYFQYVPMLGKTVEPDSAALRVERAGEVQNFTYFDDFVLFTDLTDPRVEASGEMVFAGYGIVAPEYDWNDFRDVDVKGKILVLLVNDPPATQAEPRLFGARALTYYGRWTYKFEEAARQGALGAILIHTNQSAGYPWQVVQSSWTGEQFELPRQPGDLPPLEVKAWISHQVAEKILALAGQDLEALQQAAAQRGFRPVELGLRVSSTLRQTVRRLQSPNVLGLLPGGEKKYAQEYVLYTAHYDHLGVGQPDESGDAIYNGAADNAVGVAALLAIAEAMTQMAAGEEGLMERYLSGKKATVRSQLFLAVTAEESGLLGSAYYARNPTLPLARTVACVNIDGLNTWGPTEDILIIGSGTSELDDVARMVSRDRGLRIRVDPHPEQGYFYRSDQFSLAKVGVPALYFDSGLQVKEKPEGWGEQKEQEYRENDYHQPSDEIKPDWDWAGAEQMARFLFEIGWKIGNWKRDFEWYQNAEFRAVRQQSLREAGLLED